ncbi:MAG TPA: sulfurtransferase TusA family protein [Ktedonobacterales bacterium]|jgi:TusA-related sulfurtransferase
MTTHAASIWQANAFHDAGDQGCARVILDAIAECMLRLAPHQTLEIRATDPCLVIDLIAWCRLTGHALVVHTGDRYLIRHA